MKGKLGILLTVCAAVLAINLDTTIVNVALPTISDKLDAGTRQLQWIVDLVVLGQEGPLAEHHLADALGRLRDSVCGAPWRAHHDRISLHKMPARPIGERAVACRIGGPEDGHDGCARMGGPRRDARLRSISSTAAPGFRLGRTVWPWKYGLGSAGVGRPAQAVGRPRPART